MANHIVSLIANEGIFRGLSMQNMLFHHCVQELCDNSIAAKKDSSKFRIDIVFIKNEDSDDSVDMYIADNGKGMALDILEKALQLGESATTSNRLNEHGFGLKNALATLSGGNGNWQIWTRSQNSNVLTVKGPFKSEMYIEDDNITNFPNDTFLPTDISTLIKVNVKITFMQSVQGRGAPSQDLNNLRDWLIEHLGVAYRGYLEQDSKTFDSTGVIVISIGNNSLQVPPVQVPLGNMKVEYFEVELCGNVYKLEYRFGALDEVKRETLVRGKKVKFYYQNNIPTQGIDIRLGKRVIATRQFETIWKTEDGGNQLSRHNNYNDFIGELIIPELPRGVLTTVNNKTDFNLDDSDWVKIFNILNGFRPPKTIREKSENELKKKWMRMLKATNPSDNISDEITVWPTGTRIDVYRKISDGSILIYELKVGTGSPIHLYQLKMYWDGLVIQGEQPKEGILMVEDFNTNLEEMANKMNQQIPPTLPDGKKSKPYNFKIEKHKDKGL